MIIKLHRISNDLTHAAKLLGLKLLVDVELTKEGYIAYVYNIYTKREDGYVIHTSCIRGLESEVIFIFCNEKANPVLNMTEEEYAIKHNVKFERNDPYRSHVITHTEYLKATQE